MGARKSSAEGSDDGVEVDMSFPTTASIMFDALFIPGGKSSIEALSAEGNALHFLNEAFAHGKPIGATGEAVELLGSSEIEEVRLAGADSGNGVVSDHGVVTSRRGAQMDEFTDAFIAAITRHRFWTREKKGVPA